MSSIDFRDQICSLDLGAMTDLTRRANGQAQTWRPACPERLPQVVGWQTWAPQIHPTHTRMSAPAPSAPARSVAKASGVTTNGRGRGSRLGGTGSGPAILRKLAEGHLLEAHELQTLRERIDDAHYDPSLTPRLVLPILQDQVDWHWRPAPPACAASTLQKTSALLDKVSPRYLPVSLEPPATSRKRQAKRRSPRRTASPRRLRFQQDTAMGGHAVAPVALEATSGGAGERSKRQAAPGHVAPARREKLTRRAALQTSTTDQPLDKWEKKAQKEREEYSQSLAAQNSLLTLFEVTGPQETDDSSFEERMARKLRAQLLKAKAASRAAEQVVVFRKSNYMRNCGLAQSRRGGF